MLLCWEMVSWLLSMLHLKINQVESIQIEVKSSQIRSNETKSSDFQSTLFSVYPVQISSRFDTGLLIHILKKNDAMQIYL